MADESSGGSAYALRLFISGRSPISRRACRNLDKICEFDLKGGVELETIDILADPNRAEQEKILVTPTLIKVSPLPERRVIGDFSNRSIVLSVLGLGTAEE